VKPAAELHPTAYYAAVVRPHLPADAFRAEPRHLGRIAVHLLIVMAGYSLLRSTGAWWIMLPASIVIGHSMACLLFLAHDVSHNAVIKNVPAKRSLELLLWGLNLIPPALWRRIHNQSHHVETNTLSDPDRVFRESESTIATWTYTRLFFPNRKTPFRHPFVLFHFVTYIVRHVVTAMLPGTTKFSFVTFKPQYTLAQKVSIAIELIFIVLIQIGIWFFIKGVWLTYLFAVPIPLLVASSVAMAYIFTNHFLNPLCKHSDPLIGSTSVVVPEWIDWLHDNFSYHTEHHVFPGMNPRHFPAVSRLLAEHFPDRYQRVQFKEAWRRLWEMNEFIQE
jgi:fatty acid desaturase